MRRAHGIKGELVVETLVDDPLAVFACGRRMVLGGRARAEAPSADLEVRILESRPFKGGLIVRFEQLTDRTTAERMRGRSLLVASGQVAEPRPGELFLHELEGMVVHDPSGAVVGTIAAWYEVPSGILLEVREEQGPRALPGAHSRSREATIPFHEHFVRNVDRAARTMTVDIPAELWTIAR